MQWIALYYLGSNNYNISQKELAKKMNIKESTVARLIDRMEREELVKRLPSEKDRRVMNLALTKKGQEFRKQLLPQGDKFNNLISQGISQEEFETFRIVLDKMVKNIEGISE